MGGTRSFQRMGGGGGGLTEELPGVVTTGSQWNMR